MNPKILTTSLVLALTTTGCATTYPTYPDTGMIDPYARAQIHGSVGYRERIMTPPGSVTIVQLQDVSRADAPARVIAEQRIPMDGRSVPVDYHLTPLASDLQPNMRYSVRSEIRASNGALLWTSDTANPVNPTLINQTLPLITMVKVGSSGSGMQFPLADTNWRVTSIGGMPVVDRSTPYIMFARNGQVSGNTGCNSFSGNYTIDQGSIAMGNLAATSRACVPALMDQQARFMAVASNIVRYTINPDGTATLFTPTGASMRVER